MDQLFIGSLGAYIGSRVPMPKHHLYVIAPKREVHLVSSVSYETYNKSREAH